MRVIIVRPAEGAKCPFPSTTENAPMRWLPAEGARVRLSPYWQRRIAAGDAELVPAEPNKSEG